MKSVSFHKRGAVLLQTYPSGNVLYRFNVDMGCNDIAPLAVVFYTLRLHCESSAFLHILSVLAHRYCITYFPTVYSLLFFII